MTDAKQTTQKRLSDLREEYRRKMNEAGDRAQRAAGLDDMSDCAFHSTIAARYEEAFSALNRAIQIVDDGAASA